MAKGKLMIYDEKGRGYDGDQIAALLEHLNAPGKPVNWAAMAGQSVGKSIRLGCELDALKSLALRLAGTVEDLAERLVNVTEGDEDEIDISEQEEWRNLIRQAETLGKA